MIHNSNEWFRTRNSLTRKICSNMFQRMCRVLSEHEEMRRKIKQFSTTLRIGATRTRTRIKSPATIFPQFGQWPSDKRFLFTIFISDSLNYWARLERTEAGDAKGNLRTAILTNEFLIQDNARNLKSLLSSSWLDQESCCTMTLWTDCIKVRNTETTIRHRLSEIGARKCILKTTSNNTWSRNIWSTFAVQLDSLLNLATRALLAFLKRC